VDEVAGPQIPRPETKGRIVLTGKEALDRKAMHQEELRLQRARRKEIEKQTLRDRLAFASLNYGGVIRTMLRKKLKS
jgi:hypothetical protein